MSSWSALLAGLGLLLTATAAHAQPTPIAAPEPAPKPAPVVASRYPATALGLAIGWGAPHDCAQHDVLFTPDSLLHHFLSQGFGSGIGSQLVAGGRIQGHAQQVGQAGQHAQQAEAVHVG